MEKFWLQLDNLSWFRQLPTLNRFLAARVLTVDNERAVIELVNSSPGQRLQVRTEVPLQSGQLIQLAFNGFSADGDMILRKRPHSEVSPPLSGSDQLSEIVAKLGLKPSALHNRIVETLIRFQQPLTTAAVRKFAAQLDQKEPQVQRILLEGQLAMDKLGIPITHERRVALQLVGQASSWRESSEPLVWANSERAWPDHGASLASASLAQQPTFEQEAARQMGCLIWSLAKNDTGEHLPALIERHTAGAREELVSILEILGEHADLEGEEAAQLPITRGLLNMAKGLVEDMVENFLLNQRAEKNEGIFSFPVAFQGQIRWVHLRIRYKDGSNAKAQGTTKRQFRLDMLLPLKHLGSVALECIYTPPQMRVEISVDNQQAQTAVKEHLEELRLILQGIGVQVAKLEVQRQTGAALDKWSWVTDQFAGSQGSFPAVDIRV